MRRQRGDHPSGNRPNEAAARPGVGPLRATAGVAGAAWLVRSPVPVVAGVLGLVLLVLLSDRVTYRIALLLAVLLGRPRLPRLPGRDRPARRGAAGGPGGEGGR